MLQLTVFYIFATIAVLSGLMVIVTRNPVRSVLFLILTFFATAVLWMLLEVEFLAIGLILVYVGAVMVLFLFIVMMLDIDIAAIREGFTQYLPLGACLMGLLLVLLVHAIGPEHFSAAQVPLPEPRAADYSHVKAIGMMLYQNYLFHLEVAGILLLVAMVAAISLTYRGKRNRKQQVPGQQVQIRAKDRIRMVSLDQNRRTINDTGEIT